MQMTHGVQAVTAYSNASGQHTFNLCIKQIGKTDRSGPMLMQALAAYLPTQQPIEFATPN